MEILLTGDFVLVGRIEKEALNNNYKSVYGEFLPVLHSADISITNIECPLSSSNAPIKKSGSNLHAQPFNVECHPLRSP